VGRALAPAGVAYVSFNVLPGWYERLAARDWLRFCPDAADAAGALRWLRDQASPELSSYRAQLARVAERLDETDRAYAVHEYRADEHHPQLVSELLTEAAEAGLGYLGDALPANTALELLPEAVGTRARQLDPAGAQQLIDFVRNTAFRRALFVRSDEADARRWCWPARLDPAAIDSLRMASRLRATAGSASAGSETFEAGDLRVQVGHPAARRALHRLAERAPRSISFDELAQGADEVARAALREELFDLWLATDALALHTTEPPVAGADAAAPRACPVARWHALHGGSITNRWHHEVRLPDRAVVFLLGLLDGMHDTADLRRALREGFAPIGVSDEELGALVRAALDRLASAALLVP
jgi:hypothetical protein